MSIKLAGVAGALPKRREIVSRTAGQELLLRDPENEKIHFFNAAAALIWKCCDGQTTRDDCAARLRGAFAIPPAADLAADIARTVDDFQQRGLLRSTTPDV